MLAQEGHDDVLRHMEGESIKRQLLALMVAARAGSPQ